MDQGLPYQVPVRGSRSESSPVPAGGSTGAPEGVSSSHPEPRRSRSSSATSSLANSTPKKIMKVVKKGTFNRKYQKLLMVTTR